MLAHPPATLSHAGMSRRGFLRAAVVTVAAVGAANALPRTASAGTSTGVSVQAAAGAEHWWLGRDFWANRTEDWALRSGRISCIAVPGKRRLCTASLLTSRLTGGTARLSVVAGTDLPGKGFTGFLIGAGGPAGDHRRAALVSTASGTGGGLMAVFGNDGVARFREHTNEGSQLAYAEITSRPGPVPRAAKLGQRYTIVLDVTPTDPGRVSLLLSVSDAAGVLRSTALLGDIGADAVSGGVALVSAGYGTSGPVYSFDPPALSGEGVATDLERGFGPVVATMFSVAGSVLKMTAQIAPFPAADTDTVSLQTQDEDGTWMTRATSPVGVGFTALLRVEDWDGSRDTPYRVSHSSGGEFWTGAVPAEPSPDRPLRVATINCSKAAHRIIDRASRLDGGLAVGAALPLYTPSNLYFPYEQALTNLANQRPDVLVAMGDQFYENSPTSEDTSLSPDMDFFYKYLQWLWAVRDLTRNVPTLVLVDDHDVYQGNLWGEGGVAAVDGRTEKGGFGNAVDWVNLVQRVQCGHNPDAFDPTPAAQGMSVYFTRFDYAGTTFVLLEDRKFKTSPDGMPGLAQSRYDLLGARQEAMLGTLAGATNPVVVLTQTMYACVETTRDGVVDGKKDSGGYPKPARDRALDAIKAARGVMLCGDTHLSSLVRHLGPLGDRPMQFAGPALASSYQRWFTPAQALPEQGDQPNTGVARDLLGNDYRVLAVANPKIGHDEVLRNSTTQSVGDRGLKREGYGMLIIDPMQRSFTFESWADDVDPLADAAAPYPGWPYTLSFDDA